LIVRICFSQPATDLEGTTEYVHDANGNLIGIHLPDIITWLLYDYNQRNLLVEHSTMVLGVGVETLAQFVYDGDGNRLQQLEITGNMTTTITYTNDILGLSQVLVSDDGTTQTTNLFGLDLISQDDSTETRYLLPDGLGSVRVEMVGSSVETATTYAPYGSLLARTGSSGTVYGFTGEQYDAATSLLYLRARYHNPALKIFISVDPFPGWQNSPASQHPYS
jgi:RHS repeat-associated protein